MSMYVRDKILTITLTEQIFKSSLVASARHGVSFFLQKSLRGFAVKTWLENDMRCFDVSKKQPDPNAAELIGFYTYRIGFKQIYQEMQPLT